MNKNAIIGLMLVIAAGTLACVLASSGGSVAEGLVGKAVWYAPYVALIGGIKVMRAK